MPSLSLKASVNYPFFKGSSYTPNYPPGLSGISGLVGWYDAAQTGSKGVVADGGGLVSQWNNAFNGATQGATVLPAFVVDDADAASAPAFVQGGVSYSYDAGVNSNGPLYSSGTKNGVVFDGASTVLALNGGIPSGLIGTNFTIFRVFPMIAGGNTGWVWSLRDQAIDLFQTSFGEYPAASTGQNNLQIATLDNIFSSQFMLARNPSASNPFAVGWSFSYDSIFQYLKGAFFDGSNYTYFPYTTLGLQQNAPFDPRSVSSSPFSNWVQGKQTIGAITSDPPWSQMYLGAIFAPNYYPYYWSFGALGEVLIYQGILTDTQYTQVLSYLYNKWH